MHQRIHDDEVDTSEQTVRRLLASDCQQWADLPLTYVDSTGSSNTLWRVHVGGSDDVVVRLPRTDGAEAGIVKEIGLLPALAATPIAETFSIPAVLHSAAPSADFPLTWSVMSWIDGADVWSRRDDPNLGRDDFADDMATAIELLSSVEEVAAPQAVSGRRGGPLHAVLDNLDWWLSDPQWSATDLVDVVAIRRIADQGRELPDEPAEIVFSHGDLLPGNLLVTDSRLSAIIDWAATAFSDRAHDIGTMWAVLDERGRAIVRERLHVDEETWLRGTIIELEQAVGASLYYGPRNHALGDVGNATLRQILGS